MATTTYVLLALACAGVLGVLIWSPWLAAGSKEVNETQHQHQHDQPPSLSPRPYNHTVAGGDPTTQSFQRSAGLWSQALASTALERQRIVQAILDQNHLTRPDGPVNNRSAPAVVTASFDPISITDIDPSKGVLTMTAYMGVRWADHRLAAAFDPTSDANIHHVVVPIDKQGGIWIPDIQLYKLAEPGMQILTRKRDAIVYSSGDVMFIEHVSVSTPCIIDRSSAFNCSLTIGSWVYNGFDVDLAVSGPQVDLSSFVASNHRWQINGTPTIKKKVSHYDCCSEPYPNLEITITLQRRQNE